MPEESWIVVEARRAIMPLGGIVEVRLEYNGSLELYNYYVSTMTWDAKRKLLRAHYHAGPLFDDIFPASLDLLVLPANRLQIAVALINMEFAQDAVRYYESDNGGATWTPVTYLVE